MACADLCGMVPAHSHLTLMTPPKGGRAGPASLWSRGGWAGSGGWAGRGGWAGGEAGQVGRPPFLLPHPLPSLLRWDPSCTGNVSHATSSLLCWSLPHLHLRVWKALSAVSTGPFLGDESDEPF